MGEWNLSMVLEHAFHESLQNGFWHRAPEKSLWSHIKIDVGLEWDSAPVSLSLTALKDRVTKRV